MKKSPNLQSRIVVIIQNNFGIFYDLTFHKFCWKKLIAERTAVFVVLEEKEKLISKKNFVKSSSGKASTKVIFAFDLHYME